MNQTFLDSTPATKPSKNSLFKIRRVKQIDSTNSALLRFARRGAPPGLVLVTDYQTRGHGKWGRKWISPRGKNVLFSILLRPDWKASEAALVAPVVCRSVAKVLTKKFRLNPHFKRPNDLMVNGRKICGVLVQSEGQANGSLESLVIGVGLNVNAKREELLPEATSVLEEKGKTYSRQALLKALLSQIGKDLNAYLR